MTGTRSGLPVVADLGAIIDWLDRKGRLVRVRSEVDPAHQLAGIAAKFTSCGKDDRTLAMYDMKNPPA